MRKKQYAVYLCVLHLVFFCLMWVVAKVPSVAEFVSKTTIGRGSGSPLGLVLIALPGLFGALPYFYKHGTNDKGVPVKKKVIVAGLVIVNALLCLGYTILICYGL